jgi:hypothetical protein
LKVSAIGCGAMKGSEFRLQAVRAVFIFLAA